MTKQTKPVDDRGEYRTVYCAMIDEMMRDGLEPVTRHVIVYLKLTRVGHASGIFLFEDGELATLAKQMGIPSDGILDGIADGIQKGWLIQDGPILWLKNGLRFEIRINLRNPNHRAFITKHLKGLPKRGIIAKYCQYYDLETPNGIIADGIEDTINDGIGDTIPNGIPDTIVDPTTTSTPTTTPTRKENNQSTSTNPSLVAPPLDQLQKREMDWLLKAIRLMSKTSRIFQTDLMSNGDLEVKFTKWAAHSGGIRWIIFCVGIMWRRVEVYHDGLNDPFDCALPKPIESPMSYLHSLVFPEKNGHQANFMAGEVAYREEVRTETWYKTFFKKLDTSL